MLNSVNVTERDDLEQWLRRTGGRKLITDPLHVEMQSPNITEALTSHKAFPKWKGKSISTTEVKELLETASAFSVQEFCTENPVIGSDEHIWEALFLTQFPELYAPFLEVCNAYGDTKGPGLPFSDTTRREHMFWRDCWGSLNALEPSVLLTVERLMNRELLQHEPETYFDDVSVMCESHWTLAVVLGNMDSSGSCVVPVMLCCAPELLRSVFFYEERLTSEACFSLVSYGLTCCPPAADGLTNHSAKMGFVDILPRLIPFLSGEGVNFLLLDAIESGQDEAALIIARDERADLGAIHIVRQSAKMGLTKTLSFVFGELGSAIIRNKIQYVGNVRCSALGSHLEVFRFLMKYPKPDFWVPSDLQSIHEVISAATNDLRHKMLIILIDSGFKPSGSSYFTIEHWVKKGDTECVRLLLADQRAFPSHLGGSLVNTAAQMGNIEILRLILEDGRVNLAKILGGTFNPFFCAPTKQRVDIFTLLLSHLGEDSLGNKSVAACLGSHNIEIVRLLLPHLHRFDSESITKSVIELVRADKVDILRLLASHAPVAPHGLVMSHMGFSELLSVASSCKFTDCFLFILEKYGHLVSTQQLHDILERALRRNKDKIVRLLLEDGRTDPSPQASYLVVSATTPGHIDCLKALVCDERVKEALSLTNKTLLFINSSDTLVGEVLEECIDKAIENLKDGKIEINDQLSRLQLKEVARRMGRAIHSAMTREELVSLVSPKR